jgi:hypothetical protein
MAKGEDAGDADLKTHDVAANGVSLSVTEQGGGQPFFSATGFRIRPTLGAGR